MSSTSGRTADVTRTCGEHPTGVIANGMELFEASKIPLATIADYLAFARSATSRRRAGVRAHP